MSELKPGSEHQKTYSNSTPTVEKFCVGRLGTPENGVYIKRPEVAAILEHVAGGGRTFVEAQRQQGKSSVREALRRTLCAEPYNFSLASVDLTLLPHDDEHEFFVQLFEVIYKSIERSKKPAPDHEISSPSAKTIRAFIDSAKKNEHSDYTSLWRDFILLIHSAYSQTRGTTLIFDEIECLTADENKNIKKDFYSGLTEACDQITVDTKPLSYIFFGTLAGLHHKDVPEFEKLIRGQQKIWLKNFSRSDLEKFIPTIKYLQTKKPETNCFDAQELLDRTYYWTAGQPHLTQKLLQDTLMFPPKNGHTGTITATQALDATVSQYLEIQDVQDNFMGYAEHVLKRTDRHNRERILNMYRKILHSEKVIENQADPTQQDIVAFGLGRWDKGHLVVHNNFVAAYLNDERVDIIAASI